MSKITPAAISLKPVNQIEKKNYASELDIFTPVYKKRFSKFNIPITTSAG